jgi:phosphate/sulfate permease
VVGVGLVKSGEGIKWKILFETIGAWFITLPVTGLISAGMMFLLMKIFL